MDISSKWTTFVEIAASFPVTELVQIPFPPSLLRRQLPEEFIAGDGERKQDSPPRARLLFKGTHGEEGERVGKKNEG